MLRTDEHISQFARLGLRTLVLGHKIITQVFITPTDKTLSQRLSINWRKTCETSTKNITDKIFRNNSLHFHLPLNLPTRVLWTGMVVAERFEVSCVSVVFYLPFRTKFVREIYQSMEQGLTLIGATGIEDRLQDKVFSAGQIQKRAQIHKYKTKR